jgi:hypothetical protein
MILERKPTRYGRIVLRVAVRREEDVLQVEVEQEEGKLGFFKRH